VARCEGSRRVIVRRQLDDINPPHPKARRP
jgi:hypothetical protein